MLVALWDSATHPNTHLPLSPAPPPRGTVPALSRLEATLGSDGGPEGRQSPATPHMTSQRAQGAAQPPSLGLMPNRPRLGDLGGNQPSG